MQPRSQDETAIRRQPCAARALRDGQRAGVPAATPAAIGEQLVSATRRVMADPELVGSLAKLGIEPVTDADPDRSSAFIAREIARWAPIVKSSGATI